MKIGIVKKDEGDKIVKFSNGFSTTLGNIEADIGDYILYKCDELVEVLKVPKDVEGKFNLLKSLAVNYGVCYDRYNHLWYDLSYPSISYTVYKYPKYEELIDFSNNTKLVKKDGVVKEKDYEGYETTYILIVDGKFIKSSENIDELWKYVADNYELSIDYYGLMSKDEIYHREYTDYHEGLESFIASVVNLNTGKNIEINVLDVNYMFDYTDCEDILSGFNEFKEFCNEKK